MGVWDTREGALGKLHDWYDLAQQHNDAADSDILQMSINASAEDWGAAFMFCSYAFQHLRWCISYLAGIKSVSPTVFGMMFFLDTYTTEGNGAEYELTWKKVYQALHAAQLPGMMWLIEQQDEMRRDIWDESVLTKVADNPWVE